MKENNCLILNLNTYTHYSLLSSSLSIDKIINFAVSQNQKYVAISDTNLYGAIEFYNKALKNNLIPVLGLDVFYSNMNFVVYALNTKGYKNLIKISSFIMTENKDFEIEKYLNDVFIVDKSNNFSLNVNCNVYKKNEIAFNESRFCNPEDIKIYNALKCIKDGIVCSIQELENGLDLSLMDYNKFLRSFTKQQIENLYNQIKEVDLKIEFEKNNIIEYKNNLNLSSKSYLEKLCLDGLQNKIHNQEIETSKKDEYIKRLDEELKVINEMGFNDYFLVVQDFINEAKNKDILVGPGRGSAAGSLVSYLLQITDVDPIKYNLLFERFLNPGRISMPDIDIDIMDIRRQEVVDYIFNKYGYEHVAHITTFQRMKAKMAIRDVGRVLNKNLKEINKICKLIPMEYDEDLQGAIDNIPELKNFFYEFKIVFDISKEIIGSPRQIGLHAAGIVLSKKVLTDIVPIQMSANKEVATQFSMEYLEDLGLIKMDLLGLTNLSTVWSVLKLIQHVHKNKIDLKKINLEDQQVFKDAQNGNTLGIFQLESPGMTSTVKKVKPISIEDISICSALFRPGPMKNIPTFVNRRNKKEKIEYIDPRNADILESTYGIIVYQEQVINLVKKIANFTPYEADSFRRLIAKKKGEELEKFKNLFFEKGLKNNYSQSELEKIYSYIYTFADYGFNHSHSFAYSLISYWLLYLKHYYPTEFMSVLMMNIGGNSTKLAAYLKECSRLNIKVLKPNINLSNLHMDLYEKNKILFGLTSIKGIGLETAKKIINTRKKVKKFKSYIEAISLLSENKVGMSVLESLIYAGTFDCFKLDRKYMIENLEEIIKVSTFWGDDLENNLNLKEVSISPDEQALFKEKELELLGITFDDEETESKINDIKNQYQKYDIKPINEIKDLDVFFDSIFTIKSFVIKKTKNNKTMLFVKIIDVFNNAYEVCSFTKDLIEKMPTMDLTKKYYGTFKTSSFRLTLIKILESVN